MKPYKVKITFENSAWKDIEAESEAEAVEEAEYLFEKGEIEFPDWTAEVTFNID